ncbi:Dynamin-related protein 3A [Capsicum chinense]|nr:Dynamin-related protein 3A [Capsicum chinense]
MACLFTAVSSNILTRIISLQSAKEVWDYLKIEFEGHERIRAMQIMNLVHEFELQKMKEKVDDKSQAMTTKELSGGERIHHIFQSIFVKSLKEVDPCDDLSDEDIRIAIHNATGPRNVLFVPEVPFEVLVRRQIARLLDPSLQCLRFVYDELLRQRIRVCIS